MLELGILKTFDSEAHKAGVQLVGSLTTYLDDISVSVSIAASALVVGNYVLVAIPGGNPRDACIVASWPQGSSGGVTDHGELTGLGDDDHSQYLSVARHDITARHPLGSVVPHESALNNLGDVNVPSPADEDVIYWDNAASKWKCKQPSGGSVDKRFYMLANPTTIWRAWANAVSSTPRIATVASVSGDVITMTTGVAYYFGEWGAAPEYMNASSVYVLIRNTTRGENAWVKATPNGKTGKTLQVTNAADIASWVNGNSIRTYSTCGVSQAVELDISPCIPADATAVFLKTQVADNGTMAYAIGLQVSKDGGAGTWCNTFAQVTDLLNCAYPSIPIQTNRHINARDRASGTNTLKHQISAISYIK